MGTVVEDVAVLEDLDERGALVPARALERLLEMLGVRVDRPGDERRLGGERDREGADREVNGPVWCRLGDLAELGRRAGLALREPVDAVVEHHDPNVDVAPERVDQVVATDRQGVAVAGDDPDHQVRPRGLEPRRDGGGAPVNGVEPVGVHVVRQPARAADAGDEDDVLLRVAEVGHHLLGLREDRVVPAAGAPAHLLV